MSVPRARGSVSDAAHVRPIDGMRALAIVLVVGYHLWLFSWISPAARIGATTYALRPVLETGFIGVELFFFISGFCLFLPHARAMFEDAPVPSWRTFAIRRARKIVPSAYLAIAATFVLAAPDLRASGDLWRAIWTHLTFTSGYWIETFRDWNGVFWSLSVEVTFYAVFPLVAAAVRRSPLVSLVALVSLAIVERCVVADCCASDYIRTNQLPGFVDLFALGIASAIGFTAIRVRAPRLAQRSGLWTAIAGAALAAFGYEIVSLSAAVESASVPAGAVRWLRFGQTGLGLTWAAFAVAAPFAGALLRRLAGNRLVTWIAAVSYNVYLWHVLAIMVLLHARWPAAPARIQADPALGWRFVAVAAALGIGIAVAVTYGFERPLARRFERVRVRRSLWVPSKLRLANGGLSSGLWRVLMFGREERDGRAER